ncbi:sporulation integral membrane protein YtvI [Lentibacillus halophilus]|uniref:Sporulation integral membrane protein YtvI n=1 Tax=Lentibacillus halophilus TaxID=295065 RepID=A0ABP3IVS2_9BACI
MYKEKLFPVLRACVVIGVFIAGYIVLKHTLPYIYPFLLAILLSIVLNPIVTFLENKARLPRAPAAFFVMAAIIVMAAFSLYFITAEMVHGTTYLAERVPAYFEHLLIIISDVFDDKLFPLFEKFSSFFHSLSSDQQTTIYDHVNKLISQWANDVAVVLRNVLMQIPAVLAKLPGYVAVFLFIVMAAFFMTSDWYALTHTWNKKVPATVRTICSTIWVQLRRAVCGFIKAQIVLLTITAATIYIGLSAAGINHALTIALLATGLDILPFIGTGIVFIPWIIYVFMTGDHSITIKLVILYAIVVVQRELLEPKLLSNYVGLSPLATLTAMFAGFQLWGAGGLLAGPFIAVVGKVLYQAGAFHWLAHFIKGA